jgi:hypothetical protein
MIPWAGLVGGGVLGLALGAGFDGAVRGSRCGPSGGRNTTRFIACSGILQRRRV